jgi:hypothetical protein
VKSIAEPAIVKPAPVKPAKSGMESAMVETPKSTAVKSTKSAAVEATAAAVETSGVGGIWLAERSSTQQSSCSCQSPSYPGPGSMFP